MSATEIVDNTSFPIAGTTQPKHPSPRALSSQTVNVVKFF